MLSVMVPHDRRRTRLGPASSAALPFLWATLRERGWSDARLAGELHVANGRVAKLLYGDTGPGRTLAVRLHELLGVPLRDWDEPCPVTSRDHADESGVLPTDDAPEAESA